MRGQAESGDYKHQDQRRGTTHERVITRVEEPVAGESSLPNPITRNSRTIREIIQERDHE